jgi:uncharacterized membrane protein YhaH (DUF805 family)
LQLQGEPAVSTVRGTAKPISAVAVLACALPALLLATACLLPFLNKPFLIDDPFFLTMAQQIVRHPAHPTDFTICWNLSPDCTKVSAWFSNSLIGEVAQGYVLVPTVLGGAHEWMAHVTQLVFVWIAIVAMASLVLRFGWDRKHATVGALLLVAIAPFLPMASTAMPEPLATALALVAMERLAAWKTEQKWSQGAAAAVALGLAGFARPHLVLLLPLAAFFLLESANPKEAMAQLRQRFWLWTPVFAGGGMVLAIIVLTREHSLAISPPAAVSGFENIQSNLFAYLLYLVFPFPLAACWVANRLKNRSLRAAIFLIVTEGVAWFGHFGQRRVTFLVAIGLAMLVDLLCEAWERAEHTGIFLMLWILIPLPIVYYTHLPAKYLLPCMPAIIFLCFRLMEGFSVRFLRAAAIALIVASTGYSLLILHSDAEFSDFGRDAMYRLIPSHVAAGERVWFDGQFSAYWYAPLAGATLTFPGGPQPKPGDLLVVGLWEDAAGTLALTRFPHRTLVDEVTHKYRFGRTMLAGVGLYTNRLGYWMWGLGDSPDDEYELWRID